MPYNEGNKNDIIIVHDLITRTTNKNIQKKKNKKQHEQQNNHSVWLANHIKPVEVSTIRPVQINKW